MLPVATATTTLVSLETFKQWLGVTSKQTKAISALTSVALVATAVVTAHGYKTNQFVRVAGAADPAYNGDFLVTVVDDNTLTYPLLTAPSTSPDVGTPTVTPDDARYAAMVDAACAELEQQIGIAFVIRDQSESMDGNGKTQVSLRWAPVPSITAVTMDGSVVDPTTYVVDSESGILTLRSGIFNKGLQNVVVTYPSGYDEQDGALLPRDVLRACLDLGKAIHDELVTGAIAATSVNLGASTFVIKSSKFPPSVQRVIDSWKAGVPRMIDITVDDTAIRARIANAKGVIRGALRTGLEQAGDIVLRAADAQIGPGGILGRRTGNLKRALFRGQVQETQDGGLEVAIGVDLAKAPYGRIQHQGGTIVPKNAAHLTIPLPAMLTGNGVARGTAREVISNPEAFGFTGTFTAKDVIFGTLGKTKSGRNKTATMADTGEIRTTVPLFALKTSVTLLPHPYFTIAMQTSRERVLGVLERAVAQGLAGV